MLKLITTLLIFIILSYICCGQSVVTGFVLEEKTMRPIPDADIELKSETGNVYYGSSDDLGSFSIKTSGGDSAKFYMISAANKGYHTAKLGLTKPFPDKVLLYCSILEQGTPMPELLFDYNSSEMDSTFEYPLHHMIITLKENPNITIGIFASRESSENEPVSMERCKSISDYLVNAGINPERLILFDKADSLPYYVNLRIADQYSLNDGVILTDTFLNSIEDKEKKDELRKLNRRVVFQVVRIAN